MLQSFDFSSIYTHPPQADIAHAFDEAAHRTRKGNSAANMAIIRHIALNLLEAEKSVKRGVKIKRLKAGWNKLYLLKVVLGEKPQVIDC